MRILGIVGLILMGFFYGANSALPKDGELPKGLRPDVLGAGDDVNAAKASAVREAAKEVEKIMKAHHPPLTSFVLTEDYVSKNVVDAGKADKSPEDAPNLKTWTVKFRTDNNWWQDVVRQDRNLVRQARAKQRESLTAFVIIGLSCLLLAAVGYARLDEYTHRRYTTWLRVAGVGVAGSLVAGWWWVFFQTPG